MDNALPQVGDSYRIDYGKGHFYNKLIHIRAIVDGEYIVYRYRRHFEWIYKLTDPTFFEVGIESGHIYKEKKRGKALSGGETTRNTAGS